MADALTPDVFCESAREFAHSALAAHHGRKFRRVAVDAATSLEHLAKACLAARSPALLTELRGEGNFASLLVLLGIRAGPAPRQLRTVGLRDVLARAKTFVHSRAPDADLQTLVDMRDGTVHAAQSDEVEERLVVAFARQADAFLDDLGRDRAAFWGDYLGVVDALLADAADKTAREVAVRIAGARADFERRYGEQPAEVLQVVRQLASSVRLSREEQRIGCPACKSPAVVHGDPEVDWDYERGPDGRFVPVTGRVWFNAFGLDCTVCDLHLEDESELTAAGRQTRWLMPDADPYDYEPGFDEDMVYEAWRDQRAEREHEGWSSDPP